MAPISGGFPLPWPSISVKTAELIPLLDKDELLLKVKSLSFGLVNKGT